MRRRRPRLDISKKKFSPRTDLDDRPRLGGKTPPSPGRRVPVDSPEDRRFSNRSKSHRRCRHAMETSHGRSDGRSDAGYGNRVRLGTVGKAPHCGSRTPDFAVFLVRDFAKDYRRDANAGRRPPLAVSCRRRHRLWDAGDRVSISRRTKFSPRTDLDDRPRLGGKTPPSPGRRVPVDSPDDRRFSNRSKLPARHGNFARTFRRTFRRRLWKKTFFSSNRPRRPAEARRQDPALARATRAGR